MNTRRWLPAVAALAAAALLGACGISTSGGPQAIPAGQFPNLPAVPPTTSPDTACPVPVAVVLLDELNNATPTARPRCVAQPGRLGAIVDQLLLGPTDTELLKGLGTAIPPHTSLLDLAVSRQGLVTVDLSADFISGSSPQQEQEVEQVVYTIACALTPTTRIVFEVEGAAQAVPVASGTTVGTPVTAVDDYGFVNFNCAG